MNAKKVTAALIWKNGKLLIAKRLQEDRFGGKWEFPGGKIEKGESPEQCLKRELMEEFGINATIGDLQYTILRDYLDGSLQLTIHNVTSLEGDFELHAHQEIKWVDPKDLGEFDLLDADKEVVKKLIGGINNGL